MDSPALRRYAPPVFKKVKTLSSETLALQTKEFLKGGGKVRKYGVIIGKKEYVGRQVEARKKQAKRQWAKTHE